MGVYGYEVSTKQGITREQTAERALLSQRGYLEMNEAGGFSDEIPSLAIEDKRKNLLTISEDEPPRPNISTETLAATGRVAACALFSPRIRKTRESSLAGQRICPLHTE